MHARCLPDETGSIQMILVDLTDRIEAERNQRESDHVHRVAGTVIESLAHSEDVEETATEVLALLGDELDLTRLSWFETDTSSGKTNLLASWPHDQPGPLREFELQSEITDEFGPLHDGLPMIGTAENPRALVLPILINGRLAFVLSLDPSGTRLGADYRQSHRILQFFRGMVWDWTAVMLHSSHSASPVGRWQSWSACCSMGIRSAILA